MPVEVRTAVAATAVYSVPAARARLGVAVLVRRHDHPARRTPWGDLRSLVTGRAGVLIHRLPVDGEFTMAAGREIWGFPKTLGEFRTDLDGPTRQVTLHQDGLLVVDLRVRPGLPRRALFSTGIGNLAMRFSDARQI